MAEPERPSDPPVTVPLTVGMTVSLVLTKADGRRIPIEIPDPEKAP